MDFHDRVVLVTGATGFLGSAVCKAFVDADATVLGIYLFDRELPNFKRTLGADVERVTLVKADVSKEEEMDRVVADAARGFKRIDALVNTVGGYMAERVEKTTTKEFDDAVALNLKSTFLSCRAVIPIMRNQQRGKIVSVSTRTSLRGEAEAFLYSASKAGVNRLTEALAEELLDANIQVNCVMPSVMDTPANRRAMPKADFSKWVPTDALARVIRWLCSEEADHVSGAAIPVYGRS